MENDIEQSWWWRQGGRGGRRGWGKPRDEAAVEVGGDGRRPVVEVGGDGGGWRRCR